MTAPGHSAAEVTATQLAAGSAYDERFLAMHAKITDPANGYSLARGHSVPLRLETLIVEAPDHGHETTSEAY